MRIESKLCHVSENRVIVQVTGWAKDQNLGSSLAEGKTVEDAEDKAVSILKKRINQLTSDDTKSKSINDDIIKPHLKIELPKKDNKNINIEPSDWSNELTAIDLEIDRLKWSRDEEIKFIKENLGFNNRNKITKYDDIIKYLDLLKNIKNKTHSKLTKSMFNSLLEESDNILRDLSWNNIQGREYLQREFNVSTRKELNEEQLILFVSKLKSIRTKYLNQ
tara:strand:+ start:157 stop:816 length:660 start_codon:yes stop_codon:yes gene_type:complete